MGTGTWNDEVPLLGFILNCSSMLLMAPPPAGSVTRGTWIARPGLAGSSERTVLAIGDAGVGEGFGVSMSISNSNKLPKQGMPDRTFPSVDPRIRCQSILPVSS